MTRPDGSVTIWSSNANYPNGTDPWSGGPTKVDPGATYAARGFVPDAKLPAQFINWLLNQLSVWVDYQDRIEVNNYSYPFNNYVVGETDDFFTEESTNVILFNAELKRYFLGGTNSDDRDEPVVLTSVSGMPGTWERETVPQRTPDGDDQIYQIVDHPTGRLLAWITENGSSYFVTRTPTGVWSSFSVNQPTFRAYVARYWLVTDSWLVGGGNTTPSLWSTTPADAWSARTLSGGTGLGKIVDIAVSATVAVALGSQGDIWYSNSTVALWSHVTAASFASQVTGIVYVGPEALFWALCLDGEVYTSSDGASWTLVNTVTFNADTVSFTGTSNSGWAGVASLGGVVVATGLVSVPSSDVATLLIGWNGGTQWELCVPPLGALLSTESPCQSVTTVGDRIALMSERVGSNLGVSLAYSMRV